MKRDCMSVKRCEIVVAGWVKPCCISLFTCQALYDLTLR